MSKFTDTEDLTKEFNDLPIGEQIQGLSKKLQNVNEELHQQVRDKYGVLLQQATHAERFDTALSALANEVQRIRVNAHRLQQQVDGQFHLMENQTLILKRLHALVNLLRSADSLLKLTEKLRNCRDVLQQSEIHNDLSPLLVVAKDLIHIDFVQTEYDFVLNSQQRIKNVTQIQLVSGLQERNKNQVAYALKVFVNFSILQKSLQNLLLTYESETKQSLKECFMGNDISNTGSSGNDAKQNSNSSAGNMKSVVRGPGKTPQLTTSQNYRAKFWKSMHWLLYEELYENCDQIRLLRKALLQLNEYAPGSAQSENNVHERFWRSIQQLLMQNFNECPAHVKQTLQEGLAKLLSSARSLEQRLNNEFLFSDELFANLEAGYISKCATNMKACLSNVDFPTNETVDNFITVTTIEMSAALVDNQLTDSVAAVFIACGNDLCSKLESHIKFNLDSKQVVDIPNFQQIQNTLLGNTLFYYKQSVLRMLDDLRDQFVNSPSTQQIILKSLEQVDTLIECILQPIIESIQKSIQIILLSMHREPGLNTENISISVPSMYIKELKDFIARGWNNHVKVFNDKDIVQKCGIQLATSCVMSFIHNISILRPVSTAGRQRIKSDCAFLEQAIQPMVPEFSALGNTARLLRAISHLIVQSPNELVENTTIDIDALIPPYLVLFLLFGYAGPDVQSPHTTANWSNGRLLEWLEIHTEREKLELIAGALQRYRDTARRKKIDKYDEVYPLLMSFYEKALKVFESVA